MLNNILVYATKKVKQFIEDPTVSLNIKGCIESMRLGLKDEQVKEVAHFVYHRTNMSPLREQVDRLIKEYIDEELDINV